MFGLVECCLDRGHPGQIRIHTDSGLGGIRSARAYVSSTPITDSIGLTEGPPTQDNLILLCGFHHWFLDEHGWTIADSPDGKRMFRNRTDRPTRRVDSGSTPTPTTRRTNLAAAAPTTALRTHN
jgi:hypothetical protein